MSYMKALAVRLSFFEGFFKVHYTKTSRLTYPIPLPTTVAGMFGSILGFSRKEAYQKFKDCVFGAAFVEGKKFAESRENATYLLYKKKEKGVETVSIIHEPEYYIVIGGEDEKIKEFAKKIDGGIQFLPFAGQNDFFVKDWKKENITEIVEICEVSNYAPTQWVGNIMPATILQIFPVMHNFSQSDENFTFVLEGNIQIRDEFLSEMKVAQVNGKKIALYELDKFQVVGEWKE